MPPLTHAMHVLPGSGTVHCERNVTRGGDHDTRRRSLSLQKFAHQALGRLRIAAALHQNIQNEHVLIDSAPRPMLLATNRDHDLIKVPLAIELARRSASNVGGILTTKFLDPRPDRLMRNDYAALGQQILNHAQTEWEFEILPDRLSDHI